MITSNEAQRIATEVIGPATAADGQGWHLEEFDAACPSTVIGGTPIDCEVEKVVHAVEVGEPGFGAMLVLV